MSVKSQKAQKCDTGLECQSALFVIILKNRLNFLIRIQNIAYMPALTACSHLN